MKHLRLKVLMGCRMILLTPWKDLNASQDSDHVSELPSIKQAFTALHKNKHLNFDSHIIFLMNFLELG